MTGPINREELNTLITTHQATLWAHRHHATAHHTNTLTLTITALKHYRRLTNVIDGIATYPDPDLTPPDSPTLQTPPSNDQPQ